MAIRLASFKHMLPNAFITGGSGLLGLNILLHNPQHFQFHALGNKRQINLPNVQVTGINLADIRAIESCLKTSNAKVVIHSAGMTSVDDCNADPSNANFINGTLPENLAKVCYELGIKFVQISTDHLFDGTESFVSENVDPKPLNAYGYSKALGEEGVLKNNQDALIVRTNFFAWGPSYRMSFSDFIHSNLVNREVISLAEDVFYTPVLAQNLINSIFQLVIKGASGIYNVVGSERLSKYEFGIKMADIFLLDTNLIKKVPWTSLGQKARRPADMSLSDVKLRQFLGYDQGNSQENIVALKALMATNLYHKVKSL